VTEKKEKILYFINIDFISNIHFIIVEIKSTMYQSKKISNFLKIKKLNTILNYNIFDYNIVI